MRDQRFGQPPKDPRNAIIISGTVVVIMAGVALFLFNTSATANAPLVVAPKQAEPEREIAMSAVLVPIKDIEAGEPLDPVNFRRELRPSVGVASNSLGEYEQLKGQFAAIRIPKGLPVMPAHLREERPPNSVIARIPKGYRAVTISVNAKTGVEGWAQSRAHVDVHWISTVNGQPTLATIVENAEVLSAEGDVNGENAGETIPSTVTLLVTERDAAKIHLAQTSGTITLDLRGDDAKTGREGARTLTLKSLFHGDQVEESKAPRGEVVRLREPDGSMREYEFVNGKLKPLS